jgi:hypothetical protein
MHRSMEESELTHKTTERAKESEDRSKSAEHERETAKVHAHELATVPGDNRPDHPAVRHSVGHYIERSSKATKTLRRHRG